MIMATDKELVENFVMEFADMMSGFIEDYESYSDSLARLETNVKALHKDISSVTKIVRDGNGQPPLMTIFIYALRRPGEKTRVYGSL